MKTLRCLVPPVTVDVDPSVQLRMSPFDLGRLELKVGNRPRSSGRVAHAVDPASIELPQLAGQTCTTSGTMR